MMLDFYSSKEQTNVNLAQRNNEKLYVLFCVSIILGDSQIEIIGFTSR